MVKYKEAGDKICPFCNNKRVKPGFNDLLTVEPELAERYSINNELPAKRILASSPSIFRWNCDHCGGEYPATINQIKDGYCPFCSNERVLSGFNDLATVYPELAKKYTTNNPKPANEILYTNQTYYEWQCPECGGVYNASLQDVIDGYCPYCENKRVLKGLNDLTTTHPHLVGEWGLENYLLDIGGPEKYKYSSKKNVYWLCPKCGTHYRMTINNRIINDKRHHESCWKCAGRMKNILKL